MNEKKKLRILLVDDDVSLTGLLAEYLTDSDCQVIEADCAEHALETLEREPPFDLAVLDIMMPGMSGLELLPMVRSRWQLPVIILTGRGEQIDRILGLEIGADDYVGKPFNPRELLARIHAVLRRSKMNQPPETNGDINIGDIFLYRGSRSAQVGGNRISLTTAEFDVLAELMLKAGSVVSRNHLTRVVLHRDLMPYDRSIDVHVSRVRNALRMHLPEQELIVTIRGIGYQFVTH